MKNTRSLLACFIIFFALLAFRISYPQHGQLKVTTWDAFGYYAYLPATIIYHDVKKLDWLNEIDKKYEVTGGNGWQAEKAENGNWVFKYLGGIAIMQLPFFFIGHFAAGYLGYPADGFSAPYQYALAFGLLCYCLLALLVLRKLLLQFFTDGATAVSLLLIALATNFIIYAAVDSGLSHAYIFLLYAIALYVTFKWHKEPKLFWAAMIGYTIGLATISRPTEAIMLFIPLLWGMQNKAASKEKWAMVKAHKPHVFVAVVFGLLGIMPQLIYWKITSGSFIFDVGSKWDFLNPHFRVLFGWEKGWFIYTPVAVLFIIGIFFIRKFPFQKSVLWFCLLNIWIIIAWSEWHYAASYSTRALVQSYPVFALPLAALAQKAMASKWRIALLLLSVYLIGVNLFQSGQYADGILHYDEMNRKFYGRIYLNPAPSPMDMSLLDTDEMLNDETDYEQEKIFGINNMEKLNSSEAITLYESQLRNNAGSDVWLKISANIKAPSHLWQSYLNASLQYGDSTKQSRIRLFNALSHNDSINHYGFYVHVPAYFKASKLKVFISHEGSFAGEIHKMEIIRLIKNTGG